MNEEETAAWNTAIKKILEEIETYSFMWARRIKTAAANGSEDVVAKHSRDAAIRIYGAVKALEKSVGRK